MHIRVRISIGGVHMEHSFPFISLIDIYNLDGL